MTDPASRAAATASIILRLVHGPSKSGRTKRAVRNPFDQSCRAGRVMLAPVSTGRLGAFPEQPPEMSCGWVRPGNEARPVLEHQNHRDSLLAAVPVGEGSEASLQVRSEERR